MYTLSCMVQFLSKARSLFFGRVLYCMKILERFLEARMKRKIIAEKRWHKSNFVGYWSQDMSDGSIEFWARPVSHDYWGELHIKAGRPTYLGKYVGGELIKCDNFYDIRDMSYQRGAMKMWQMCGIYERK